MSGSTRRNALQRGGRAGFGESTGVLVVDMARLMVDERWTTPRKAEVGRQVTSRIATLLEAARAGGYPIFFSRDGLNYFMRGPRLTPAQRGSWAYKSSAAASDDERLPEEAFEIADELAPRPDEVVFKKTKPSAFFASPLETYLNWHRLDTLIICGMVTSGCVRATITDAYSYNYRVIVPRECVGDADARAHEANLYDIERKLADVVPLAEVLSTLELPVSPGAGR